jgi:hypothetical protein
LEGWRRSRRGGFMLKCFRRRIQLASAKAGVRAHFRKSLKWEFTSHMKAFERMFAPSASCPWYMAHVRLLQQQLVLLRKTADSFRAFRTAEWNCVIIFTSRKQPSISRTRNLRHRGLVYVMILHERRRWDEFFKKNEYGIGLHRGQFGRRNRRWQNRCVVRQLERHVPTSFHNDNRHDAIRIYTQKEAYAGSCWHTKHRFENHRYRCEIWV